MEQDLTKIEKVYDTVAKEYAETFSGEHEKKPMDREILRRFAQEIGHRKPGWDLGCGPGQTTKHLTNLGLEVSGLDLSEKTLEQARVRHPGILFRATFSILSLKTIPSPGPWLSTQSCISAKSNWRSPSARYSAC
jgi:ubiquinone/menaquinone biosynthesis C-methylase UbiE